MRSLICVILILFAVTPTVAEEAENAGLLPPPGSWASYQVKYKDVSKDAEAETWTVEIRFLDRVKRGDKFCRWIEFQFDRGSKEPTIQVLKLLLPEEELLKGKAPFRELIESYNALFDKDFKSPPNSLQSLSPGDELFLAASRDLQGTCGVYFQALSTRRQFSQRMADDISIDCQKGTITCSEKLTGIVEGLEPELRLRLKASSDANYELWLNDQVPTGFAAGLVKSFRTNYIPELKAPKVIVDSLFSWALIDFGTGAKSKLPDQK